MKKLLMLVGLIWTFLFSVAGAEPAPLTEADFQLGKINAITDTLTSALEVGGKLRVDYEKDTYIPPVHLWVFKDLKMYTDLYSDKILMLSTEESTVATPRGVRIGATKHKVVTEYGVPKKERTNGMICYVYQKGHNKIIFDVTAGYVEAIIINCLPSVRLTLEGE